MSFSSPMRVLCAIPRSRPTSLLRSSSATAPRTIAVLPAIHQRSFHAAPPTQRSKPAPRESHRPTDISELDVLGSAPIPSTNIEATLPGGFLLNSGLGIFDGAGALLVGGEAFAWKPWLAKGEEGEKENAMRLVNAKGQFDLPAEAFSALSLLWPRPDLLVLGVGPTIRPISPETRRAISALGMRVEVLDTRNAVAHFNMLAIERGVDDIAGALIPIGWVEGKGAVE